MATEYAADAMVTAFEDAVSAYGFLGILRAGWVETATIPEQAAQGQLVDTDELDENFARHVIVSRWWFAAPAVGG